jgi:hypothetical protein
MKSSAVMSLAARTSSIVLGRAIAIFVRGDPPTLLHEK